MVVEKFGVKTCRLKEVQSAVKESGLRFAGDPIIIGKDSYVRLEGSVDAANLFWQLFKSDYQLRQESQKAEKERKRWKNRLKRAVQRLRQIKWRAATAISCAG